MERKDWTQLLGIALIFALFYFVPYNSAWFNNSVISGVNLLNDYAKQHVITCLIPALFIAGAITVFVAKEGVIKYLGQSARRYVSYGVASISGAILAVCSCTILPLFVGIRERGAGLGPATTFLFAGPAINVTAMFLTISVLGAPIGLARIVSSIAISILVGLTMASIFREQTQTGSLVNAETQESQLSGKSLLVFFALMVGVVVANGLQIDKLFRYSLMAGLTLGVACLVLLTFRKQMTEQWLEETWRFGKTIIPLLFVGVFVAGFIMPLLPQELIERLVGRNDLLGTLIASVFGAFMYFSTLTEIPIVQALMSKGLADGPALALLLSGPSLSLPSMLVLRKTLGTTRTIVYITLVVVYSAISGLLFGVVWG